MNRVFDFFSAVVKDTTLGVKGYFKSRLIIMAIVFLILSIGFLILDAPMPYFLAFIISLIDMIPLLGAGIVIIPWGIFSYFWVNRDLGTGIIILYVVLTISRQFFEPKILGNQIGIRPLYTFLITLLGSIIFGPIGLFLGPLIAIIINAIIKSRNIMDKR